MNFTELLSLFQNAKIKAQLILDGRSHFVDMINAALKATDRTAVVSWNPAGNFGNMGPGTFIVNLTN